MYQSRFDDLDKRVAIITARGKELKDAFEEVEKSLRRLQEVDPENVSLRFFTFPRHTDPIDLDNIPYNLRVEMQESKQKLEKSCLEAFITLLEAEREDLIKQYNKLTKIK